MTDFPSEVLYVVVPFIIALFKAFGFVREGEQGILLRFGKAVRDRKGVPKMIQPGLVFYVPFVHTLVRHPIRQQVVALASQRFLLCDGMTVEAVSYLLFRVNDVYKALFEVSELEQTLTEFAMGVLRQEMSKRDHNGIADTTTISTAVLEALRESAMGWGVEVVDFKLTNCAPPPEMAQLLSIKVRAKMLGEAIKEIGLTPQTTPPSLAAVLIGAPLVSTVNDGSSSASSGFSQADA